MCWLQHKAELRQMVQGFDLLCPACWSLVPLMPLIALTSFLSTCVMGGWSPHPAEPLFSSG